MQNITFEQFNNAEFTLYKNNPIIRNPLTSFVVADPSVLTPDESHDKKWHLFCHTFFGIYRYESDDGINFKKAQKIVPRAMRPDINYIDGKYYLFYERTRPVIFNLLSLVGAKWISEIYCTESTDLKSWSEPYSVLPNTRDYEKFKNGSALSNPFLLKIGETNRLYYSCGQTFIKDCGFCEPTHISYAESTDVNKGYTARTSPIISPDKNKPWLNLCSGCIKIYKLKAKNTHCMRLPRGRRLVFGRRHTVECGRHLDLSLPLRRSRSCTDGTYRLSRGRRGRVYGTQGTPHSPPRRKDRSLRA